MEYLDFELVIISQRGRTLNVMVTETPDGGTPRADVVFPFTPNELKMQLLELENALLGSAASLRRAPGTFHQPAQRFGTALFNALMTEEIGNSYRTSRQQAANAGKGLRLRLRIEVPELATLPWEFLYDSRRGEFLSLDEQTPIVRWLEMPFRPGHFHVEPPLRILGMVTAPYGVGTDLDVEREKRLVNRAVAQLEAAGKAELTWLQGQTWSDLQQAMWNGPWHIFHFIGHGGFNPRTDEGELLLADENGRPSPLGAAKVGRLLAGHLSLRLVLLNSCVGAQGSDHDLVSSTAGTLIQRGIPAVLAMQYPISDRAAIIYSRVFYEALVHGLPVDRAVTEARKALSLESDDTIEWGTPVFFMNTRDGVLFDIDRATSGPSAWPGNGDLELNTTPGETEPSESTSSQSATAPAINHGKENEHTQINTPDAVGRSADVPKQPTPDLKGWRQPLDTSGWTMASVLKGHRSIVRAVAFSPDGKTLASGSDDKIILVWRLADGTVVQTFRGHGGVGFGVNALAFSPDGKTLASGGADKTVRLWHINDGQAGPVFTGHSGFVFGINGVLALAFTPDGTILASGGADKTVRLWQVTKRQVGPVFTGHAEVVRAVAFAPDGKTLASGSDDKTILVWRLADGTVVHTFRGHGGGPYENLGGIYGINALAFSPDGKTLASGGVDRTVRLWHIDDGQAGRVLSGHQGEIRSIAFTPDGRMLASASEDGTVRLWRRSDGKMLRTLEGNGTKLHCVAFSPDGAWIAAAAHNGSIVLWVNNADQHHGKA